MCFEYLDNFFSRLMAIDVLEAVYVLQILNFKSNIMTIFNPIVIK